MLDTAPHITLPRFGYSVGCLGAPQEPSVRIATELTSVGWFATCRWTKRSNTTTGIAGPYVSRRAAILGLREELQERRRIMARDREALRARLALRGYRLVDGNA